MIELTKSNLPVTLPDDFVHLTVASEREGPEQSVGSVPGAGRTDAGGDGVVAVRSLPEPSGLPEACAAAPLQPRPECPDDDPVGHLAARWATLALASDPAGAGLCGRLATLLHRLAGICRSEPFWPLRARTVGAELLQTGLCGDLSGPLAPAEDVLPPSLALLREHGPAVFGLSGPRRNRLTDALDQLAAGFAAALRDRVRGEHQDLLRTRLAQVAAQDALTLLPNRSVTEQWLHRAFTAPGAGAVRVGLCALDLDGFTAVNDGLGHGVGDRLLVAVAGRLQQVAAPHLVTRTGGDEFAVLVEDAADACEVHGLASRVQGALTTPFRIGPHSVSASASVGVAVATPGTAGPAGLMRAADVALSWAKAQGGGRVVVFDPDRDAGEAARAALMAGLRDGVERGEFRLHYQPLVGLDDGRVRGAEALVRWQHPVHGLLGPGRFVGPAERTGAIVQLGRWVLEESCRQAAAWWRACGPGAPYVSVNVSPVQLVEPGWVAEATRVMQVTNLPPAQLQLEITEQALLRDEAAALDALTALRDAGVRLALDDFGTGYSGLAWLRRLPVQALKIDGSFVDGLRHPAADPVDSSIVDALVRMAHALKLEVTAEWVENGRQVERLREIGCDLGQGRWFGDAGPAAWVATLWRRSIC
jgi:diguanylate cyclase (GGDEF)-like protein